MFNQRNKCWQYCLSLCLCLSAPLPHPPLFVHVFVSPWGIWLHVMVKVTFQEINDRAKQNKWPGVCVCLCVKVYVWWMPCTQKRHKKTTTCIWINFFFKPPHGSWQRWLLFTCCSWCLYLCALSVMLLCVHTCGCGGKLPAHVLFFSYKNVTCDILSFLVTFFFFFLFFFAL